ncbi:MAG: hydroxymethylglutaryl-CoA lyase [Bacteroidetes bacterium]|nr:hydroxymethylglutaryl-CoA lyase [Bacteroidota bacterium]
MKSTETVFITECPRDAMQGIGAFIPTELKIEYLNQLLQVGFDRLDFGSFVSPKAIPQLRDTREVLDGLTLNSDTDLLAIVANSRGATEACEMKPISIIGFPFSVSETFQMRNTNKSIEESFVTVNEMIRITSDANKNLLVYLSMAFGNPYGDAWDTGSVLSWIHKLKAAGIKKIALADTVGLASENNVKNLTKAVLDTFPDLEVGIHLHCEPGNWHSKVAAAYDAGCRRFDSAIKGFGGCPMAEDDLVGNLATEHIIQYLEQKNVETLINKEQFGKALVAADKIFLTSH